MIVLWNFLILHARWGGMIKDRGVAVLAIAGNIITAWSWFGTNMLGVGLHSYGFMDSAVVLPRRVRALATRDHGPRVGADCALAERADEGRCERGHAKCDRCAQHPSA
jgi:hypothetical protein